jgi:hypothetical protein
MKRDERVHAALSNDLLPAKEMLFVAGNKSRN